MGLFNFKKNKKEELAKSPLDRYLDHLNNICQKEARFFPSDSHGGVPGVATIAYADIPEKGFLTAFTYGLSLVNHPDWITGRPELCISVESPNLKWGYAMNYLANRLRGDCPFRYGETINFREKMSEDSDMDAFFIFAPSTFQKGDYLNIDIGLDYKINIAGLYPIYSDELDVFQKIGLEKFWHHPHYDNYSVNRQRIRVS